ncbi:MAG: response regulator, partial [Deltaproteobacteria bacterium]|nr:response regulator [Deltaproteobacteria bacterium]
QVVCRAFHQQLDTQPNIVFESCRDPTQAQDVAARFEPSVILLDLEMPKLNGFELIARFRATAETATVPIIVLSGITDVSAKVRAFSLGASDYAEKKMERVELTRRITYHSRAYRTAERLNDSITQLTAAKDRLERQGAFVRRTFGRYLSDEIVASILETPEGLELGGEKRVVTVMMTDLRSFTPLGELLSPHDLLTLLNNYLRAMTDVLLAHYGTIDEFIGDAILAVFGAPISRPDDAPRAVACAVAMQLAMDDVNTWNRRRGLPELAMGIGIHTGEVVVGNIGSERRAKYGIVGANVNLTARIESYTLGGQIFASAQTVAACNSELRIDDEREVLPKGFSKEITIYDIGGIGGEHQLFLAPRQEELKT